MIEMDRLELERIRAWSEGRGSVGSWPVDRLLDEITRLTDELAHVEQSIQMDSLRTLKAERDHLRAALEKIATTSDSQAIKGWREMRRVSREALAKSVDEAASLSNQTIDRVLLPCGNFIAPDEHCEKWAHHEGPCGMVPMEHEHYYSRNGYCVICGKDGGPEVCGP